MGRVFLPLINKGSHTLRSKLNSKKHSNRLTTDFETHQPSEFESKPSNVLVDAEINEAKSVRATRDLDKTSNTDIVV